MKSPLSQDFSHIPVDGSGHWGWSVRAGRVGLATHVRPQTLKGHNFFVRTPFRVFLDSMERLLGQDFINVSLEGIR